jgi:5'-nucleotidase/UDP-sugar diphosphatase
MKKLTLAIIMLLFLLTAAPTFAQEGATVTLLHFSDYHSHAVPFYAEGQADAAGLARSLAYLKPFANDPNALVFNGGDMLNVGATAWSDKYQCAEWSWFNGLTDAMAFGNHDADYGPETFAACQAQIDYPILSSNVLGADGQPLFQYDGKTYQVFEVNGVKIGVFAVAGPDFERLVKPEVRPVAGGTFSGPVEVTQEVVKALREQEQVNAVVMIGHGLYEDNIALAQAVPGIDVIFGTHSHRKEELTQLPDTNTFYISPFQYLTYVSQVELTFDNGTLTNISGKLVQMSRDLPEDPVIAQQVNQMQAELEADPEYAALFEPIGEAVIELSTAGQFEGEGLLGNFAMDIFRERAQAHMALSTASAFRQPIPPGTITEEILRSAMPYPNQIFVFDMTGAQVEELLNYGISRKESDFFPQVSGVCFNIVDDQATNIQTLADPANPAAGYSSLDPTATYQVATSDFVGLYAGGYKDIFGQATYTDTGLEIREEIRQYLRANSPVTAQLDGRITVGAAAPAELPVSGGTTPVPWTIPTLGFCLIVLGLAARRTVQR